MVICRACCRSGLRPWTPISIPILRLISHMVSRPARAAQPVEHHCQVCPTCSHQLTGHHCKLVCTQCGYYLSCADYY